MIETAGEKKDPGPAVVDISRDLEFRRKYHAMTRTERMNALVPQMFISMTTWSEEQNRLWKAVCDEEVRQRQTEVEAGTPAQLSVREEVENMFPACST